MPETKDNASEDIWVGCGKWAFKCSQSEDKPGMPPAIRRMANSILCTIFHGSFRQAGRDPSDVLAERMLEEMLRSRVSFPDVDVTWADYSRALPEYDAYIEGVKAKAIADKMAALEKEMEELRNAGNQG